MNYRIKPGYIMLKICDTHLLVAKRELWKENNRVRILSRKYALCWALMEKGRTSNEVIQSMATLFHKPPEVIGSRFSPVFQNLAKDGYLIEAEEEEV